MMSIKKNAKALKIEIITDKNNPVITFSNNAIIKSLLFRDIIIIKLFSSFENIYFIFKNHSKNRP